MQITCHEITASADQKACFEVRRKVFVEEQKVPPDREVDGQDESARHFAVRIGDKMLATCRVRMVEVEGKKAAKIERVAVLKDFRGKGIGKTLMTFVVRTLVRDPHIRFLKLSTQTHALAFYEKLGFEKKGEEYMDAGIPHYDMVRTL